MQNALVHTASFVDHFRSDPPGKLFCVHGDTAAAFRMSLSAAAHALMAGVPVTMVDGTNRFDVYYIAEFARKWSTRYGEGVAPSVLLDNLFIARAFTCYQMEATITERLPAFVHRRGSPIVIIFGLLDTFYDEQAPIFEVRAGIRRMLASLEQLKRDRVSVLLASRDVRIASRERSMLFPGVMKAMDRVFVVNEENKLREKREERREEKGQGGMLHGTDRTDVYDGFAAGNGQLGEIPARVAQGRPGRAR